MSKVISISREFGSGGREIGYRLAKKLGFLFMIKRSSPWPPKTAISPRKSSMPMMK